MIKVTGRGGAYTSRWAGSESMSLHDPNVSPTNLAPTGADQTPSLIELFSARSPHHILASPPVVEADQAMWDTDSVHRINNLVQLFHELPRAAARLPGQRNPAEIARQAAALAEAYAELGKSGRSDGAVPCTRLLRQIVVGLISLFEPSPGTISLTFASDELSLSHDRRRALVLIASELIINALKYAFPTGGGGKIGVSLTVAENWVELVVDDNGVGLTAFELPGRGVPLIDALCAKLDATLERASPKRGLRISLNFRVIERSSAPRTAAIF